MSTSLRELPILIWVIPCIMLVTALLELPYGYYTFLRIVVCGTSGLIGIIGWSHSPLFRNFSIVLFAVATLFNPLVPIHFEREVWMFVDIVSAIIMATHAYFVKVWIEKTKKGITL